MLLFQTWCRVHKWVQFSHGLKSRFPTKESLWKIHLMKAYAKSRSPVGIIKIMWLLSRICKRLRSPGIDSKKLIPPAHVTWRATMTLFFVPPARLYIGCMAESIPGLLKRLQIRALVCPSKSRLPLCSAAVWDREHLPYKHRNIVN